MSSFTYPHAFPSTAQKGMLLLVRMTVSVTIHFHFIFSQTNEIWMVTYSVILPNIIMLHWRKKVKQVWKILRAST